MLNLGDLKTRAAEAAAKTVPETAERQGAALVCKDGSLYTGQGVTFADETELSACDLALAAALTDGKTKFLAAAFYGKIPPKVSLERLARYGDIMILLTDGQTQQQTTLKKLILARD